jgi:subtilisin family serine protease
MNGTPGSSEILTRMTKRWISFWTVLLALALGGQSHAAQPGQAGDAGVQMVQVGGVDVHPTHILARLKDPAQAGFVAKRLAAKGYTVKRQYRLVPGMMLIERPAAPVGQAGKAARELKRRITELQSSGWFLYVETDRVITLYATPDDAAFQDGRLWGLLNNGQNGGVEDADIDADEAWDITTGSRQIIVSVIDTGVRYTHVDLKNQMWVNEDEIPGNGVDDDNDGWVDNVYGIDSGSNDGDPMDPMGHGTHCAGTIGAEANNGEPHVGVAWDVTLMACKIFGGGSLTSAAITAIEFSVENGATVANCSWGGTGPNPPLYDVIAAGGEAGMMFSCASGNSSMDNDAIPDWPSGFDLECVIAVAATDNQDLPATFTNYGKTTVDLAAPGVDIFSSVASADDAYDSMDGTSMSGPHVAGVIALMQGMQPSWSVLQIREKLLESVDVLPSLQDLVATSGRVNAFKAVQGMGSGAGLPDGNMEVSIKPSSGSVLLADTNQKIFVTVIDGAPVVDAVVIGILDDGSELYFNNDGDFPDAKDKDNVYSYYLPLPEEPRKMRLTLVVTAPDKEDYLRVVKYDIVPVPENDQFADAAKLAPVGGVVEAFNTFATMEVGEPKHSLTSAPGGSLWWNWSPSESGTLHVDISGSDIDGVVSVYYGTSLGSLVELASNLPLDGLRPDFVQFEGKKGKTYRIVVASLDSDDLGYIRLRAEVNGQPDINSPYVTVTSPPNGLVTTEKRVELIGSAVDPSPNSSGIWEVSVRVNNSIGVIAVGAEEWSIPVVLSEGLNKIEVFAVDYSDNVSKPFRMELDYRASDVPNDHFSNATQMNRDSRMADGSQTQFALSQPIADVEEILVKVNGRVVDASGYEVFEFNSRVLVMAKPPARGAEVEVFHPVWTSQPVNTDKATRETGEPEHAGNEGGGSVWWAFTAPYDGLLNVRTANTRIDTVMGAYVGTRVNRLRLVTSNDDDPALAELEDNPGYSRITQALKKGMTLMVAADGFGDMRGELAIVTDFEVTAVHELNVTSGPGGAVPSPWLPFGSDEAGQYALYAQDAAVQLLAKPGEGNEFYGWQGSISSLENPLDLVITSATTVQATFGPRRLADDFESGALGRLPWQSGGTAWFVQQDVVADGEFALQSGDISDQQASSIKVRAVFSAGTGSFSSRVDSEENWDKLEFLIDGRVIQEWSGLVDWNEYEFKLTSGTHELEWRYRKDFANSRGADAAWLDNVNLPLSLGGTIGLISVGDQHRIRIWGRSGHRYDVQVSSDLVEWKPAGSVIVGPSGVAVLPGSVNTSEGAAYYRAVAP